MKYTKQHLAERVQDLLCFSDSPFYIHHHFEFDDCICEVKGEATGAENNSGEGVLHSIYLESIIVRYSGGIVVKMDDRDIADIEELIIW